MNACIYCTHKFHIFSDEGVHFPIQKGIELSRSKVRYFKHNNMEHLEELLEAQRKQDIKVCQMSDVLGDDYKKLDLRVV